MSTQVAPPSGPAAPDFPPPDLRPSKPGAFARLFAWVARKPKTAFWVTLIGGVVLGIMIGGSGGVDQSKLDQANADAARARGQAGDLRADLNAANGRLGDAKAATAQLNDKIATLSAKGQVPSLTGIDV